MHQLFRSDDGLTELGEVAVGVDRRGVAHVAWVRPTGAFRGPLYAARHKLDGRWSAPVLLARKVEDESVVLSANPRGDVLVTGVHAGSPHRLFAVRRPAGAPYEDPVGLSGQPTKIRASSDLAANGAAAVLYSPLDDRHIYARSFTA